MKDYKRKIVRPVGLNDACDYIDDICSHVAAYNHGALLKHMIVPLDEGEGRTTFVCYVRDMFEAHHVLPFTCSSDTYIEATIDASSPSAVNKAFSDIFVCADYENEYSNIVAMDITSLANYVGQSQYHAFISHLKSLCKTAFVILFVPEEPMNKIPTLLKNIRDIIGEDRIEEIPREKYTCNELSSILISYIEDKGLELSSDVVEALPTTLAKKSISSVKATLGFANDIIREAEYSKAVPLVSSRCLRIDEATLSKNVERRM